MRSLRRLWLVAAVSLVACDETGRLVVPKDVGHASLVADLLDDDADARFGRAHLRWDAAGATLGIDGPPLEFRAGLRGPGIGELPWSEEGPKRTAVVWGERVLVRAEGRGVSLVLAFPPEDAHDLALADLHGGTTFDGLPGDEGEGVHIPAGNPVEITASDDAQGTVRVDVESRWLNARTWVPADRIGKVFDPATGPPGDVLRGIRVGVRAGAALLDAPDGFELATMGRERGHVLGRCALQGARRVDAWDGWTRIRVRVDRVEVDGWVDDDDLGISTRRCSGCGYRRTRGVPTWGANLAEGTRLLDGPDGELVGRVIQSHHRSVGEPNEGGWAPVRLETLWGVATVWVDSFDLLDP